MVADADWAGLDGDDEHPKQLVSFDIYLKGNVSKATSFFRNAGAAAQQRFRMFPYVEKKRRVDEYGETVDVGMWLRKGKVFEEEAESEEVKEARRKQQEEEEGGGGGGQRTWRRRWWFVQKSEVVVCGRLRTSYGGMGSCRAHGECALLGKELAGFLPARFELCLVVLGSEAVGFDAVHVPL